MLLCGESFDNNDDDDDDELVYNCNFFFQNNFFFCDDFLFFFFFVLLSSQFVGRGLVPCELLDLQHWIDMGGDEGNWVEGCKILYMSNQTSYVYHTDQ